MTKVDLKNAFRHRPVRCKDWHLLGIHWCGFYFIDKCLPFRSCCAPNLFSKVAETIEWILCYHYPVHACFQYVHDSFFISLPQSQVCMQALTDMCNLLRAPVKPKKIVGPATTLPLLGIELDSLAGLACLPADKLHMLL